MPISITVRNMEILLMIMQLISVMMSNLLMISIVLLYLGVAVGNPAAVMRFMMPTA